MYLAELPELAMLANLGETGFPVATHFNQLDSTHVEDSKMRDMSA